MKTERIVVDPSAPDPRAIARCADVLLRGGLVAFATETVYGLGALADDDRAARSIFEAKGRPPHNPLISHVADVVAARRLAPVWTKSAELLASKFWPGPLTLVVQKAPSIASVVCAGLDAMSLRVPAHPTAQALLKAVGRPIAAPSANRSNALSPTNAEHVLQQLDGRIHIVLDAGPCAVGLESTVIDLCSSPPVMLRPGRITIDELRAVLGAVDARSATVAHGAARSSPGLDAKHYAPRARLELLSLQELRAIVRGTTAKVGVVSVGECGVEADEHCVVRALASEPEAYGAALYEALHSLDDAGCEVILCERVPPGAPWDAARDRLARASAK
jgi:L-threonylcarbamoyladenylate synthase